MFSKDIEPTSEFKSVYVLETKGLHLKGNEDTVYKEELFALCNELCQPRPWDEIRQEMARHHVQYQLIYENEWQRIFGEMAAGNMQSSE